MQSGQLIREARLKHGLTQQQLATRARTSQAAISRIERGLVSPSMATVENLLHLLGENLALSTEPIEYGFDLAQIRRNLRLTPEERIRKQARFANAVREFQRKIGVEPVTL